MKLLKHFPSLLARCFLSTSVRRKMIEFMPSKPSTDALRIFAAGISSRRPRVFLPLLLLVLFSSQSAESQQELRFGVLGLFHPRTLSLEQEGGQVVSVAANGTTATSALVINGEPNHGRILFHAEGSRVFVGNRSAARWTAMARDGSAVPFRLVVPGRFQRVYRGRLTLEARKDELIAVVAMENETAVASVVAAEMDENAPIEALKAQAVATRSYLAGGPRHLDFDFCDTTHCQFLKSPPTVGSRVTNAVLATKGMVIAYRSKPLAAMYSSQCGGHTRSLNDVGMSPGDGYPYYSVTCVWCQKHPITWKSRMETTPPNPGNERMRVVEARQWGWGTIPGNDFSAARDDSADGSGWKLKGHSVGHGVGMCQHGAVGMAIAGAQFQQIILHYYPNTVLISSP